MRIPDLIPRAEVHNFVQSQIEIYVMIDYFTDVTMAYPDDGLYLESTLRNQTQTELGVEAQTNPNYNSITMPNNNYTATEPRWK